MEVWERRGGVPFKISFGSNSSSASSFAIKPLLWPLSSQPGKRGTRGKGPWLACSPLNNCFEHLGIHHFFMYHNPLRLSFWRRFLFKMIHVNSPLKGVSFCSHKPIGVEVHNITMVSPYTLDFRF